jgi:hypothetical protein
MKPLVRGTAAAWVVASAMLLVGASASAAAAAGPKPVHSATITGVFSATVVQGTGAGTAYKGTLHLDGSRVACSAGRSTPPAAR